MKRYLLLAMMTLIIALTTACGSRTNPESESSAPMPSAPARNVSMNKEDYPVFPDADIGADPAVSAEQGGKGFTGKGWETNTTFDFIGDPHAIKGGLIHMVAGDFPSTIRPEGPNITTFNRMVSGLVYETLLGMHPTSLDYIPALASHWQISADKTTYRFRINPNARWADGQPVTANDVVASWSLWMDKGMSDPMLNLTYAKFEKPVAESKYIVRVKTLKPNWRNFLYFSNGMEILPAHILKTLDGASFVRDYNYKMVPGSGPYAVSEQDVDKGKTIRIRRRNDYWADKQRRNIGANNFDEIRVVVVRDRTLEFEMFKKGDLDFYYVNRAQMWAEDLNFDAVNRGLIQKVRIWNHSPQGMQGMAMNTRRPPFDDIRIRKALGLLFNREQIIQKLMYGDYKPSNSIYPGSMWENPADDKTEYDPQQALQLLAQAGYNSRDAQGHLMRNGTPLTLELVNPQKDYERYLTVYQEDLRKVGITLNLRLLTFETLVKLIDDRQFGMLSIGYSADLFPNPETQLLSSLADQNNTNNTTGFKNRRVDELIAQYDTAYDIPQRVKILQEIDKLFTDAHHWLFEWYAPYMRVVYWNKFGYPKGHFTRIGDYTDIIGFWWFDPVKTQKLEQAKRNPSMNFGQEGVDDKYWLSFEKVEDRTQLEKAPNSK